MILPNSKQICAECQGVCCQNCTDGYFHFSFFNSSADFEKWKMEYYPFLTRELWNAIVKMGIGNSIAENELEDVLKAIHAVFGNGVVWTKETGFLTKTGCSIPRQFRSRDCLRFACSKIDPNGNLFEWVKKKFERGLTNQKLPINFQYE